MYPRHFQYWEEDKHLNKSTQLGMQWLCVWGCYRTTAKDMAMLFWDSSNIFFGKIIVELIWNVKEFAGKKGMGELQEGGRAYTTTNNERSPMRTWCSESNWGVAGNQAQGASEIRLRGLNFTHLRNHCSSSTLKDKSDIRRKLEWPKVGRELRRPRQQPKWGPKQSNAMAFSVARMWQTEYI